MTPTFSVIVPTYNRRERLEQLLRRLESQTMKSFEVVVADQTPEIEPLDPEMFRFPLKYVYLETPGATRARNEAIRLAEGELVAFTDDDCEPDPLWLANAEGYFRDDNVVGVEGRIEGGVAGADYPYLVSNIGLEGMGFLTANLFVRLDALRTVGGFDERFDHPHFREDTDLAWRLLGCGRLPFADDVKVFHPPLKREFEGVLKRFIHDCLLCHKHSDRFFKLLRLEGHYRRPGYWQAFAEGLLRHRVTVPLIELKPLMEPARYALLDRLSRFLEL